MGFQKCLASSFLCPLKGRKGGGLRKEREREKQNNNKIQYTVLTAAQYTHIED